jgi:hypothetical protein
VIEDKLYVRKLLNKFDGISKVFNETGLFRPAASNETVVLSQGKKVPCLIQYVEFINIGFHQNHFHRAQFTSGLRIVD